jgi:hypothetical protein
VHGARDRVGEVGAARGHVVERAVRLHVRERRPLGAGHAADRRHLVQYHVVDLVAAHVHVAAPEAHEVRQPGMRADRDPVAHRLPDGVRHRRRVARVEAAGDVRRRHVRQHRRVVAHAPGAEALAHVAVEVHARHECVE